MSRRRNASALTTQFSLEAQSRVPDGGGGWTVSWQPLGSLWAEVLPSSAAEREHGGRPYGRVTHRLTVRSAPAGSPRRPRADQRLVTGDRIFRIRGVAEARDRGFLTLWCEEGPLA